MFLMFLILGFREYLGVVVIIYTECVIRVEFVDGKI